MRRREKEEMSVEKNRCGPAERNEEMWVRVG